MMEEASTSETSINFYQTTRYNNPEDNHLYIGHCENLISHKKIIDLTYYVSKSGGQVTNKHL
jgi:hypothetical protein